MKKIQLNITIENKDENVTTEIIGIKDKDVITYDDNGVETKLKMSNKVINITRKNNEYSIELNFKEKSNTICKYLIFKDNINIDLDIYTSIIEKKENSIKIEYELYNKKEKLGEYKYKIIFKED